jgi:hypothetical protein
MGLFTRFGKWIDRGIERIIGKPQPKDIPIKKVLVEPVWKIRKRITEEARALWREEARPVWQRRMEEAIEKHREEGMDEEEIIERYGVENT